MSIVSQSCSTRIAARNDRIHTSATHLRSDSKRLRFRSVVCIQRIAPLFQEHASTMLDEIGHHVRAPCAYSERGQSNHWLPQNNRVYSGGRTQCEWSHNPVKEWRSPSSHVWPFDTIVPYLASSSSASSPRSISIACSFVRLQSFCGYSNAVTVLSWRVLSMPASDRYDVFLLCQYRKGRLRPNRRAAWS